MQSRQRFGAPEQVDFGGGCKPVKSEKFGKDLIVTFDAAGNGLTDGNFAAKLIGKTAWGKLWFGYSRLPGVDYSPYVIKRERHQADEWKEIARGTTIDGIKQFTFPPVRTRSVRLNILRTEAANYPVPTISEMQIFDK